MKKNGFIALCLALSCMSLTGLWTGCSRERSASKPPAKLLTLFAWKGMFPQEILDGFEEETGVKINYEY
ncbi:MAG: hypothetical protein LBP81_05500 [Treponema sp.]|jgi:spermidine/putrescine transport system substrate-binding protein|nr:hypothetical protein [Treponema sp.]